MGRPRNETGQEPDQTYTLAQLEHARAGGHKQGYQEGHNVGYGEGFKAGKETAVRKLKPPLFEAAKKKVLDNYTLGRDELSGLVDMVEAEYEETLSQADRDLILANAQRRRQVSRAYADREQTGARPRTPQPKPVDPEKRAETEYELVQ